MKFTTEKLIKTFILILLKTYKLTLSPFLGNNCRFLPPCSDYAQEAILNKGIIKGGLQTIKRLTKCHPWGTSGYDPVNKEKENDL